MKAANIEVVDTSIERNNFYIFICKKMNDKQVNIALSNTIYDKDPKKMTNNFLDLMYKGFLKTNMEG